TGVHHLYHPRFDSMTKEALLAYIKDGTEDRIFAVAQLLRLDCPAEEIMAVSSIDRFFIQAMKNIVDMEKELQKNPDSLSVLRAAKRMGFSDGAVGWLW